MPEYLLQVPEYLLQVPEYLWSIIISLSQNFELINFINPGSEQEIFAVN